MREIHLPKLCKPLYVKHNYIWLPWDETQIFNRGICTRCGRNKLKRIKEINI